MPRRAPSPCSYPGCGALAVEQGRCEQHPRPHKWGKRPDERQRYGVSSAQYARLKRFVRRRDGDRCYQCKAPATAVDHIMPLAEGGAPADPNNLGVICSDCHDIKTRSEIARSNQRRARV